MSKQFHAFLLIGVSVVSLAACSGDKGPGAIGSKDDIVVVNKGMPGAQQSAQGVKAEGEDFTSSVEQAEAAPAPEVAAAEELTPAPATTDESANKVEEGAITPAEPMPTSQPVGDKVPETSTPAPVAATTPAPESMTMTSPAPVPTTTPQTPTPAAAVVSTPTPAPVPVPEPTSAPAPSVAPVESAPVAAAASVPADKKIPYPLDPNAPYSPKAMAAAAAAAGTPVVAPDISPSGLNLNDPAIIRAVQGKMAEQKLFVGPQTGMMSADLMNAVAQYQVRNNLAIGPLNEETLKHMGIIKN